MEGGGDIRALFLHLLVIGISFFFFKKKAKK